MKNLRLCHNLPCYWVVENTFSIKKFFVGLLIIAVTKPLQTHIKENINDKSSRVENNLSNEQFINKKNFFSFTRLAKFLSTAVLTQVCSK